MYPTGGVSFEGTCNVSIGSRVRINSGKRYNVIGGDTRTVFRTVGDGKITIGEASGISNSAFVSACNIEIGKNVLVGGNCKFYDTDFHPIDMEQRIANNNDAVKCGPIKIEDGVFIGSSCIILKGVTIGTGSVIGAGSIVTKSVPAGELWAGNPAHFIKKL